MSLLPVVCNRTLPPPATAAADFIAVDESTTHRWLCKGQSYHAMVPASEWICWQMARDCGLPVPPAAVVTLRGAPDIAYFGSQWLGGAVDFFAARGHITNADLFAKTHAVDLFAYNIDRHCGNFLYLDLAGEIVARVIDFSHALLVEGWPLPSLPLPAGCHTMTQIGHLLRESSSYTRPTVVLDRLAALPDEWMRDALQGMPGPWLSEALRLEARTWWVSRARHTRIQSAQLALP